MAKIVITYPLTLGMPGGGTRDCRETARHLRAAGAEVTLLPVFVWGRNYYPHRTTGDVHLTERQEASLRSSAVTIERVSPHPLHWWLDGWPMRQAVVRLLDRQRPDVVLSWGREAAFLPNLLRGRGILFGMIAAGSYWWVRHRRRAPWHHPLKYLSDNLLLIRPLRAAQIVFTRSEFTRRDLHDIFAIDPARVCVAPCGIDPMFASIPRTPPAEADRGVTRLIYYGRLRHDKGVFDAVRALGRLAAQGQRNWTLKIIGWGDPAPCAQLDRDIERYGLREHVVRRGRLEHPDLMRELEWAQLAILPSYGESFGLAVAESQAAGLAVIAYAAGAIPEVLVDGVTGRLVPTGHVDQLAVALGSLLAEPERLYRMGLSGRERAQRFTWVRTARTMLDGIEDALGRRGGSG